jgi:hypothetical protein
VSTAEYNIIRRASVLIVELERMEAMFAQAGEASVDDLDAYQRVASSLRRLLEAVGIRRRPRDIGAPTCLAEYLEASAEDDDGSET